MPTLFQLLEPVGLFQVEDLGAYLMVHEAKMKLVVEKHTRRIVKVSGGARSVTPCAVWRLGLALEDERHRRHIDRSADGSDHFQ